MFLPVQQRWSESVSRRQQQLLVLRSGNGRRAARLKFCQRTLWPNVIMHTIQRTRLERVQGCRYPPDGGGRVPRRHRHGA
jgi:hypothetical protein